MKILSKKILSKVLVILICIESISLAGQFCIQILQSAYNPITGECRTFPTPCDIPEGWIRIDQCKVNGIQKYQFLTEKEKKLVDQSLDKFFKNLYKYDLETQIKKLENIVNKIDTILPKFKKLANDTKSRKYVKIIDILLYLKEKLSKQISLLQINLEAIRTESGK